MPQVMQVSFAEDRVIIVDPRTQKTVEQAMYEEPADNMEAIKGLRQEVQQRGKQTRYALSMLVQILNNPRMDGYKAAVPLNTVVPKECKSALREMEDEFLRPIFLDSLPKSHSPAQQQKEWDTFIKGLREPGVYARVRGVCLKYFAYLGMLPCVYDKNQKPDTHKLLAVSAMEKILANESAKSPRAQADHSIPAELGSLMARMLEEKDKIDVRGLETIEGRLAMFMEEVRQLKNLKALDATAAREAGKIEAKAVEAAQAGQDGREMVTNAALTIPEPGETAQPVKGKRGQRQEAKEAA